MSREQPQELPALDEANRDPNYPDETQRVSFAPNGMTFAAACTDGSLLSREAGGGKKERLAIPQSRAPVVFAPSGKALACAGLNELVVYDLAGEVVTKRCALPRQDKRTVMFVKENILVTGDDSGLLRLWDVSGEMVNELALPKGHPGAVTSLAVAPEVV